MSSSPKMRRVLITGGAGFIGTHLAERLAPRCEVVLLDNLRRDSLRLVPSLAQQESIRILKGDILDSALLEQAVDGVDTVIHLAAIAGVSSYYDEPLRTLEVNVLGTVRLLEAAARRGIRQFIHFSTSEVYGADALWASETSVLGIGPVSDLRWVYATSKLTGEQFVLRSAEKHRFAATVVRPFNIYGPRQTGEGAISNFCRAVAAGEPVTVYGDGSPIRAWCYVSDLVDAVDLLLTSEAGAGEVYNVGNPAEVETTLGLARRVAALAPGTPILFQEAARSEVRARIPSIEKAKLALGFEPKIDLEQGLRATLDWFRSESSR